MLMTRPHFFATIDGVPYLQQRNVARRFKFRTASKSAALMSFMSLSRVMPALLTSTSTEPISFTARSMSSATNASSVTLPATTSARLPACLTSSAVRPAVSGFRSFTTTPAAPSSARRTAMASPRPCPAPVTTTNFPCKRPAMNPPTSADGVDAEQLASDDELLDLRRTLGERQMAEIAIEPLHRELARIAVPAVHLDRELRDAQAGLGREELRLRGLEHGLVAAFDRRGGSVGHQPTRLREIGHFRDHRLHELEGADRLAELLALFRVADRCVERRPREPDGGEGDCAAALREPAQRQPEALARLADQVAPGNQHVLERQLGERRGQVPHLLERPRAEARCAPVDDEARRPHVADPGDDDAHVGHRAVRDERLRAAQ